MAHIDTATAQQAGAFNNGAVGQQFTPLCQWPYVWDRVRKTCVLPDDWAWAYEEILPWGWGERFTNPSRGNELFSYGPPVMDNAGPMPMGLGALIAGMGATCPEGSSKNASYIGPLDPNGSGCRCAEGRVWHNGYCQSPESVVQQSSAHLSDYAQMSVEEQMAQPLSEYSKKYFAQSGHTASCKLVYPTNVPGGPNYPTMMCSIDGGPYVHGAYAINLNPGTAIISENQRKAGESVAAATGVAPGSVLSTPELQQAVVAATNAGGSTTNVDTQTAQQSAQLKQQLQDSLVRGVDYDRPDGKVSWRAEIAGSGYSTMDMVQEALNAPPGFMLGQSVDTGYAGTGIGAGSGLGVDLGSIPWYVWAAVAGGAYMVFKKK